MKKSLIGIALAISVTACSGGSNIPSASQPAAETPQTALNYKAACDAPRHAGYDTCYALVRTDVGGAPNAAHRDASGGGTPAGYGPSQLQAAYDLTWASASRGSGQTVALIESGDYPTAQADLNVYRAQYGLPPCGAGCFTKVSQTGSTTNLPAEDAGWAEESALDEDMVSAICPNCNILMVEANSASFANLAAAAQEAAALGANEISNSYGGSEYTATNAAYSYPNIVVTASSGDDGYSGGVIQPCSYASVVCTGGTTLSTAGTTRGYSEVVWNELRFGEGATGSGCSAIVSKPSWQNDTGCKTRTESDVAFDADPETGVAVYDSTSYEGYAGWLVFGGTSVSSPSIASVYALAGNASALGSNAAAPLWSTRGSGINSVTTGFNTLGLINRCPILYVCVAGTNADGVYSGPAGWGTPNGITLF